MINIKFSSDDYGVLIEVDGHAGYSVIGKDVVCAAVSGIINYLYILSITIKRRTKILKSRKRSSLKPGKAIIYFDRPVLKKDDDYLLRNYKLGGISTINFAIMSAIETFDTLKEQYPGYITVEHPSLYELINWNTIVKL